MSDERADAIPAAAVEAAARRMYPQYRKLDHVHLEHATDVLAAAVPHMAGSGEAELRRTDDRAYDLRQRLNRAMRWLRDAEDIARVEMPAWPTADRIRDIYEQISEDVLNGTSTVPPILQRLREAEAEIDRLRAAQPDERAGSGEAERLRNVLAEIHRRTTPQGDAGNQVAFELSGDALTAQPDAERVPQPEPHQDELEAVARALAGWYAFEEDVVKAIAALDAVRRQDEQ